jgi:hypothetical protein
MSGMYVGMYKPSTVRTILLVAPSLRLLILILCCLEYLEVISDELRRQGGEQCVSSVEQAVAAILSAVTTPAGLVQVSEMF